MEYNTFTSPQITFTKCLVKVFSLKVIIRKDGIPQTNFLQVNQNLLVLGPHLLHVAYKISGSY